MSGSPSVTAITRERMVKHAQAEIPSTTDRVMNVCIVSFKECWQDESGAWCTDGGFPMQMAAIATLFDNVTLLICRRPPKEGGTRLPTQARVIPMDMPTGLNTRRKLSVIARLPYYVNLIRKHVGQADVLHVPLPGDLPLMAMITAICMRKPVIARYCGSWAVTSRTTVMNRVTRSLMRTFSRGRHVMLATGEGASAPAAGMEWVFATALSRREIDNIAPRLDRGRSVPPHLVFAGRLSPEKNVQGIIRAMAELKRESFPNMPRLTVLGGGRLRAELEQLAEESGCGELVEFAGQVNREELSRRMRDADLCVQPSLSEGFSKAWLDAMAHGVPVLTCDVGAAREVIGHDGERGWVVAPGDQSLLTGRLRDVLSGDIDWPSLRRRCRDYAESRTLEAWAERIGVICAERWQVPLVNGRLIATT